MYSFTSMLSWLMTAISALVGVAFITLYERKILGLSQNRLGPNKAGIWGIIQPVADAVKLFLKSNNSSKKTHFSIFNWAPPVGLALILILWSMTPLSVNSSSSSFGAPTLLALLSLNVYPLIFMAWASHNSFTTMGALRGVAQSISYEISLAFILMTAVFFFSTESIHKLNHLSSFNNSQVITLCLAMIWMVIMLAETNRAPFDFAEGESELVSGFNTEYGASGFALIFMAEYASIMFLSLVTVCLMAPFITMKSLMSCAVVFGWVWARATYPRHRYDLLMNLAWKSLLPLSLYFLIFAMVP